MGGKQTFAASSSGKSRKLQGHVAEEAEEQNDHYDRKDATDPQASDPAIPTLIVAHRTTVTVPPMSAMGRKPTFS